MRKNKEKTPKPSPETPEKITWGDLLGFEKDKALLKDLVREERLPSVLLFEGKSGIGKSSLLFYLAALHFCEKAEACGNCPPCHDIAHHQNPDLLVVKADGDTLKVSTVSDISEFIAYSPQAATPFARRIVLIIDAENLTIPAVNKLLKTLEEPSSSARIFISTSRIRQLLPTLLSRCVRWRLRPPSVEDVESIVLRKFPNIRERLSQDKLRERILRFNNSPARILSFLESEFQEDKAQNLLRCRRVGEILSFAEEFRQQAENRLSDFIPEFEYALNALYRDVLLSQDSSRLGNLVERRLFLNELKNLIHKHKIALNAQMVIEKLGFYNLQIPVRSDGRF